jgi:hypothetical protein
MNIVSIASIKRSGMNAIDSALAQGGPAYLMKHNRAGHVIMTREHYETMLIKADTAPAPTGIKVGTVQWMLQQPMRSGGLTNEQMKERLAELRDGWGER